MTGTLSAMDDPPCPECESAIFTVRYGPVDEGRWKCEMCGRVFKPSRDHRGNS